METLERNKLIEGNKLINEFRGLKLGDKGYVNGYHTNWNSLMMVVEDVIQNIDPMVTIDLRITKSSSYCKICNWEFGGIGWQEAAQDRSIKSIWSALVKYINLYNKQNK